MDRRTVDEIIVKFEDGSEEKIDVTRDAEGVYNYTALFWDTHPIVMMLAKYYPVRGVKLTPQLKNILKDVMTEESPEGTANGEEAQSLKNHRKHFIAEHKTDFDEDSIFPGDILYCWNKGRTEKDKPCDLVLKTGMSPPKYHDVKNLILTALSDADPSDSPDILNALGMLELAGRKDGFEVR